MKLTYDLFIHFFFKKQAHGFHLVTTSFLPFLSSVFILCVLLNLVAYLHDLNYIFQNVIQIIFLTIIMYWFNSIVIESMKGFHVINVQKSLRLGMLLFIVSEIMFFFAFFWGFFHFSIAGAISIGQAWPPVDTQDIDIMGLVLPVINTILLLSSGVTITLAHHYILKGQQYFFILNLLFTIILGIFFLICQAYEYKYGLIFSWKEDIYGTNFFITTGFHGLHVTIGTIFLTYCLMRAIIEVITHNKTYLIHSRYGNSLIHELLTDEIFESERNTVENVRLRNINIIPEKVKCGFTASQHLGFEAAAWYWHFVDVVWLFLFLSIYFWNGYSY